MSSLPPASAPAEEPRPLASNETCTVSPSQHVTWRSCERKWGFQKLLGLRHDSAASILGGEVHAVRERYLVDGAQIDQGTKAGLIASTGLHQIPRPGQVWAEVEFSRWLRARSMYAADGGLAWYGIIDMLGLPGEPAPSEFTESCAFVGDHKTTSDLKWAKTEAQLRDDPQWNIYVDYAFSLTDVDRVKTLWHYVTTKKPLVAKPVVLWAERNDPHRQKVIEDLRNEAVLIETVRRKPPRDVNELRPNFAACRDYGGCPFAGVQCKSSLGDMFSVPNVPEKPSEPPTQKKSGAFDMSDFKAKLAAMKAGGSAAPTSEAPVNPPAEKRGPGRPAGSPNKPKPEGGADTGAIVAAIEAQTKAILEAVAAGNAATLERLDAIVEKLYE